MAINYPGSQDDNTTLKSDTNGNTDTTASVPHDVNHNNANAAIKAIETKLGTGATTPTVSGQVLRFNGANSLWQLLSYNDLTNLPPLSGINSGDQTLSLVGKVLTISGANGNSVTLPAGGGGGTASSPLTTKGDIWVYSTVDTRLPVGTDGQVLTADSTQPNGMKWASVASGGGTWGSITGTLANQTDLQTALNAKASLTGTETLTNKTLTTPIVTTLTVKDTTDSTKIGIIDASVIQTGTTKTFRLPALPSSVDTLVARTETATLSNKTLDNTTVETIKAANLTIQDATTTTKQAKFDASAITAATTRTYTLPDATGTIALTSSNITGTAANVTGTVAVANGGTGSTTAATARTALGAAASGSNADITALTASPAITTGTVTADPTAALGIASKQYVDKLGTTSLIQNETPGGTINGTTTAFTTASTYATGSLRVYLNGQRLTAGSGNDYVEVTQGFTMQYAPATGDVLLVDYNLNNTAFIQGSNSIIVQETPTGTVNGTTTLFTVLQGKYVANSLEVFINGLQQTKTTDYTETSPVSGTFTFVTAPLTGDVVKVSYQFSTGASGNADTVDGFHASATPTANTLLPLDSNGTYPQSAVQGTTLGYASLTTNFTTTSTSAVQVTGLTATVIIPAGGRRIKITAYFGQVSNNSALNNITISIWDGSVNTGTQVGSVTIQPSSTNQPYEVICMAAPLPSAGSKTYNIGVSTTGTNTTTLAATPAAPAFMLVELI